MIRTDMESFGFNYEDIAANERQREEFFRERERLLKEKERIEQRKRQIQI